MLSSGIPNLLTYNKSLDRSGASVFCIKPDPAQLLGGAVARSTPTFDAQTMFPRLSFTIAVVNLLLMSHIAIGQRRPPRFEDFRVNKVSRRPPGRIDFSDRGARMYRTRLLEAAKNKPNFAGHYVITDWGCGTECLVPVAIDARTGKTYFFGFSISYSPAATDSAMDYRLNSRLIIINGYLEDDHGQKEHGTYYYEWRNNRLVLLRFVKKPIRDPAAPL